MKISTFLSWSAFLAFSLVVRAGTLFPPDPDMEIDDGLGSTGVGSVFSFFSDANGGGIIDLQNISGFLWTSIDVSIPFGILPDQNLNDYHCHAGDEESPQAFKTCSIMLDLQNKLLIRFQGADPPDDEFDPTEVEDCCEGIPDQGHFVIKLGETGWGPNQQFQAQANVPEPGTILFVSTALLGFWWAGRHRQVFFRKFARLNSSCGRTP